MADFFSSTFAFPVASWTPREGDLVVNFGQPARIVRMDERGWTLREVGGSGLKWVADPAKCHPAA